jgi:phenylalanine-4-hydroxylase
MEKQYYSNLNGVFMTWQKKSCIGFSGPADANSFDLITNMPSSTTIKAQHSAERDNLEVLYQSVRMIESQKIPQHHC